MFNIVFIILLAVPALVEAQVTCSRYGDTVYCDGKKPVSITEFSPGMGIIQTEKDTVPYTILGDRDRRSAYTPYDSTPLKELDPLPSYSSPSSSYSSGLDRYEGRTPSYAENKAYFERMWGE